MQKFRKKSEEATRKISRNASSSRISYSNPASRKVSQNDPPDRRYLSSYDPEGPTSSQQVRSPGPSSPMMARSTEFRRSMDRSSDLRRSSHYKSSRKISTESEKGSAVPLTVETTSLADFLRALDTVHHKLKTSDTIDKAGDAGADRKPGGTGQVRRRKIGVFNPGFSFVNQAYDPDGDETAGPSRSDNPPTSLAHKHET